MSEKLATLKKDGDISTIILDDGKANVFSTKMSEDINMCLDEVPLENGCLIITGKEGMFSAGFDLKTIQGGDIKLIQEMTLTGFKLLSRIFSFPRPVIAACSGHGIALGTFLLCCCDYRIGIKGDFMLGANEMRTNMVIPPPILELIKFRVAQSHKYRAVLGAEMYSLSDGKDAGLIDEIVEPEDLLSAAMEKAKDLATMGHPSYSLTKELFIGEVHKKINDSIKELEKITQTSLYSRGNSILVKSDAEKNNLVKSVRGAKGGYVLEISPEEIKISNIISAVDEEVKMLNCKKNSKKRVQNSKN